MWLRLQPRRSLTVFAFGFAGETQRCLRPGVQAFSRNGLAAVIADAVGAHVQVVQGVADFMKRALEHCFKGEPALLCDHGFSCFINGNRLAASLVLGDFLLFRHGLANQPSFLLRQFRAHLGIALVQPRAPFAILIISRPLMANVALARRWRAPTEMYRAAGLVS